MEGCTSARYVDGFCIKHFQDPHPGIRGPGATLVHAEHPDPFVGPAREVGIGMTSRLTFSCLRKRCSASYTVRGDKLLLAYAHAVLNDRKEITAGVDL